MQQILGVGFGHGKRAILLALTAAAIAQHIAGGVVKQHTVTKWLGVVRTRRHLGRHGNSGPVEVQHALAFQPADVHALMVTEHTVKVHFVQYHRAFIGQRVKPYSLEPHTPILNIHRPVKALFVQIKAQDSVEGAGREKQAALPHRYFLTVLQVGIAPGLDEFKVGSKGKQFITGGDINALTIDSNTTQSPVPAAALPVDARRIPVNGLLHGLCVEVNEVDATATFTLFGTTHNRAGDELNH